MIRFRFLLRELVARDLSSRYAGSLLGFLWAFVHPLWQLALFSLVFGYVLRVPLLGERASSFPLFLFAGQLIAGQQGLITALVLGGAFNFIMYFFSDRIVLKMYGARVVSREEAPELYAMVDRLRQRAGLPMPVLAVTPAEQPNAFATGRSPSKAVVAVTTGILKYMPQEELEGVIAENPKHDYGHTMMALAETLTALGEQDAAIRVWKQVTENHSYPRAKVQLAELYLARNQPELARAEVRDVVADDAHAPAFQRRRDRVWISRAKALSRKV